MFCSFPILRSDVPNLASLISKKGHFLRICFVSSLFQALDNGNMKQNKTLSFQKQNIRDACHFHYFFSCPPTFADSFIFSTKWVVCESSKKATCCKSGNNHIPCVWTKRNFCLWTHTRKPKPINFSLTRWQSFSLMNFSNCL